MFIEGLFGDVEVKGKGLPERKEFDLPTVEPLDCFTDDELMEAKEALIFDVETYPNYTLLSFMGEQSGKIVNFEMTHTEGLDLPKLKWVCKNFKIVTFNGLHFDVPILNFALNGASCKQIKEIANALIESDIRPWKLYKDNQIEPIELDHIDVKPLCPKDMSLKILAGRLNCKKMQDLPFEPSKVLSLAEIDVLRVYCKNDLENTRLLYRYFSPQIAHREKMSEQYGQDLRSKSDAQIAEAVIKSEIIKLTGHKPDILKPCAKSWKYKMPHYIKYETPELMRIYEMVRETTFETDSDGVLIRPPVLNGQSVTINKTTYTMGIGGLHSTESTVSNFSDDRFVLKDRDVASYYPNLMLNSGMYPENLGQTFTRVFSSIVETRLKAKKAGDKVTDAGLKITVNGTYGKLAQPHSVIYAPHLSVQVTLTGQLSLLMLIEWLETAQIEVISANTDGIVSRVPRNRTAEFDEILSRWERATGLVTEETVYKSIHNRDVNTYFAITEDGKIKGKGMFAAGTIAKTPNSEICYEAVKLFVSAGVPIEQTVNSCTDLTKFLSVRNVKGGALSRGEYLGKSIRWYYQKGNGSYIFNAKSGNLVPESYGAKPVMQLPDSLPCDIDYDFYINKAKEILSLVGL